MSRFTDNHIGNIIRVLDPFTSGTGTHFICNCPFCGKKKHLYLQKRTNRLTKRGKNASFFFQCKKCGENGTIFKLATKLGLYELLIAGKNVDIFKELQFNLVDNTDQIIDVKKITKTKLPLFFKHIYYSKYLQNRGFKDWQYELYKVGISTFTKFKDRIIFPIENKSVNVAFLSRTVLDKETIKQIEENTGFDVLRYNNSKSDFGSIIGGYDEISKDTTTVICAEGIFDKASIDRAIRTNKQKKIKCICTFGKSIQLGQINLLREKTSIKNIVIFFDPDAIKDIKKYSFILKDHFNVSVCFSNKSDPGDLTSKQIVDLLKNRRNPLDFYLSKLITIK